jgi:hypothetical protein
MMQAKTFPIVAAATISLVLGHQDKASAISAISTIFSGNNAGSVGGALYFDVNITNAQGLVFTSIDTNVCNNYLLPSDRCNAPPGRLGGLNVYITGPGVSFVGNQTNAGAWSLVASGTGASAASNTPTSVNISDFTLAPGQYGFALVANNWNHAYTNGTGSNQSFSNSDLALSLGSASNVPFTQPIYSPRVWNGTLYYQPQSVPGPLPILGVAAAFGFSRQLRKRIKRHRETSSVSTSIGT